MTAALERGLPARFLHPSGVYGPAPVTTGVNDFVRRLARGEIPMLLPGGMPVVFAADVARGHLLAEHKAPVGARFILSESYQSLQEMARAVQRHVPSARVPAILPRWVAKAVSTTGGALGPLQRHGAADPERPAALPDGRGAPVGSARPPRARLGADAVRRRASASRSPISEPIRRSDGATSGRSAVRTSLQPSGV